MPQCRDEFGWVVALVACAIPVAAALAADELAAYVGGSIGPSDVRIDSLDVGAHATGWKGLIGVRGLGPLGAEAEYVDLGRPPASSAVGTVDTWASGPAVFGLFYLPIPVPHLGVFAKAEISNIQQRVSVTTASGGCDCVPGVGCDGFNRSESEFAWGTGAELKASSVTVRLEFEQFRASGGSLKFGSVGVLWSFL